MGSSSIKNPARSLLTQEQYIKTKAVLNKIREQNGNVVDGKYSAKEMKVAFGMTDSDGDGKLSKEEITQTWKNVIGMTDEQINIWFKFCDVDGSGYLDAEEVLAWMKSLEEEHD